MTTGRPPRNSATTAPVVVGSGGDALVVRPRPVVLVEHGAGQTYDVEHTAYAGGPGREGVVLFLCPNDHVAQLNADRYPGARSVVVGSPRLDALLSTLSAEQPNGLLHDGGGTVRRAVPPPSPKPPLPLPWDSPRHRGERTAEQERAREGPTAASGAGERTVALSFHWDCRIAPEARWAYPHYAEALAPLVASLWADGIATIGAGHPRYHLFFQRLWARLGIEHIMDFDAITRRAQVYVGDNSSSLWEAAACGLSVVVLNAPWYGRDVVRWPRFWDEARVGHQADEPDELEPAVRRALASPAPGHAAAIDAVFPMRDGRAAERAAHAITAISA